MTATINMRPVHEGLLVLDYGSQYTLLIARRLRELGAYAEVVDGLAKAPPVDFKPVGIILSGGPDSVGSAGSRDLPDWVLQQDVPILGICYGMGLLVHAFGGKMRSDKGREYGKATLYLATDIGTPGGKMFYGLESEQTVWMSHGDDMASLPPDFMTVGKTDGNVVAAISHKTKPIVGLQFHPEVKHSENGMDMLENSSKTSAGHRSTGTAVAWCRPHLTISLRQSAKAMC